VRSAALRGGFHEVVLHHDHDLTRTLHYAELVSTPGVELRPMHLAQLFEACAPFAAGLADLYARLRTPATRSDLVRFALLYSQGGVYLDMDTVTLRPLEPLCRNASAFCGEERIVYPAHVRNSLDPWVRLLALTRSHLRTSCRLLPRGWATFRRLEQLYPLAANPAVLASAPRSTFVTQALTRMLAIPRRKQPLPNVIGPHLLQHLLADPGRGSVVVHPAEAFFPLPPEISCHWFRDGTYQDLAQIVSPDTRVVHWYASGRNKHLTSIIDPTYVRCNAERQLFSKLALPFT
ncbi:MAG: hypothetical protein RLZZ450_6996, partial [Pseudomonadota bacterium]|jgi:hypothetical protein